MAALPFAKILSLTVKTVAKPFSKILKAIHILPSLQLILTLKPGDRQAEPDAQQVLCDACWPRYGSSRACFSSMCALMSLAATHWIAVRARRLTLGSTRRDVTPLDNAAALEYGAEFVGEFFIYGYAAARTDCIRIRIHPIPTVLRLHCCLQSTTQARRSQQSMKPSNSSACSSSKTTLRAQTLALPSCSDISKRRPWCSRG